MSDLLWTADNPLPGEILAHPLDVARQHVPRLPVGTSADPLREITHRDLSLPVQDVVGGKIAVYPALRQQKLDGAHHHREKPFRLLPLQRDLVQSWRGHPRVAV